MKTKNYFFLIALVVFNLSLNAQESILFAGNDDEPADLDIPMIDTLTEQAYEVFYIGNDSLSNFTDSIAEYDLILFSETISSSGVTPYMDAGYPVPCVCLEGYAAKEGRWEWITDDKWDKTAGTVDGAYLVITDNSHYITSEYSIDEEVPWTTATDEGIIGDIKPSVVDFSTDIPEAVALADLRDPEMAGKSSLWAIPETSAPVFQRVVYWGVDMDGTGMFSTDDYFNILVRSVTWALGKDATDINEARTLDSPAVSIYPNPASIKATFEITLQEPEEISIDIYDISGKRIRELYQGLLNSGKNSVVVRGKELVPGIYFYKIESGNGVMNGKLRIVK
jgi:hypothetical protein